MKLTKQQATIMAQDLILQAIDRAAYHIDESLSLTDRQLVCDAMDVIYRSILVKQAKLLMKTQVKG